MAECEILRGLLCCRRYRSPGIYRLSVAGNFIPEIHPLNKVAANLSGISVGTVIMVVGLIRDKRVDDARKETNKERQRADKAGGRRRKSEPGGRTGSPAR